MNIFRIIELSDGGPNDRGRLGGYIEAKSEDHARKILNINHGFTIFRKISYDTYNKEKQNAYKKYKSIYSI